MENFFEIKNADELHRVFSADENRLIILMFYTKNAECKRARAYFEKSSMNHTASYFCVIDVDKFQGESRFVNNVSTTPKFECYYAGNQLGSCITSNEKQIEEIVQSGERYVITQNNMRNNGQMNQMNTMNPMNSMNQFDQVKIQQIRQNILNNAQMSNPAQYQYLVMNPMVLNGLVQQQIRLQQSQQMPQMNQMNSINSMNQMMPQMQMNQMNPMNQMNSMNQMNQLNPMNPMGQMNQTSQTTSTNNMNSSIPNLQQMQQMFQIFQMMQQMGVLNTQQDSPVQTNSVVSTPDSPTESTSDIEYLPNGDKIVKLANGKYGLIKKVN